MRTLSTTASQTFVTSFSAQPQLGKKGVQDFLNGTATKVFVEGTVEFDELRYCLLRESEQSLLMSINCYARALEGLRASSVYWSSVSLYYAAFFAAKAVLGTYGCWMSAPNSWIDVVTGAQGKIKLQHKTSAYGTLRGSHKVTWEAYYSAMAGLSSFLTSTNAIVAKTPVNNKRSWLIDTRNDLNYYPQTALHAGSEFEASFDPNNVPACFKGKFQTMLRVSRACVLFAKESATRVNLSTDVWEPEASRADYVAQRIIGARHPALSGYANAELPNLLF